MGLTVSIKERISMGNRKAVVADITFDSSYASGGESLTAAMLGLIRVNDLAIENPIGGGFSINYDRANAKLQAYKPLLLVSAEPLTVTTDVGTLANLPAAILAIHGTVGGSTSTVFKVVATARTLATGECKVNYTTGAITFYASDDPTAVTVDYLSNKMAEVTTGANLSSLTVRVIAIGC